MYSLFSNQSVLTERSMLMSPEIRQRWTGGLLFAMFALLWFRYHPYMGIWHDGIFYAVQALHYLHPQNFTQDLFFLLGSQDDYTLFSPIYANLAKITGLAQAAKLITLFGMLLWCFAAWRISSYWPGASRWLFLFLLTVMPIRYAGNEILGAAEPFAVPRLWADSLALLACALWLERKPAVSMGLLFMGALMHPIMALAGGAFIFFYELRFTRRWVIGVAAVIFAVCLLALVNVPVFGRLFRVMDPVWYDLVYYRTNFFMFPSDWGLREYNVLIFHATALLWAGSLAEDTRLKRVFMAAFATGLAGWGMAIVGGEWLRSVLVLQVQAWRLLWLMYVLGWGAVAWLVPTLWRRARFAVLGLAAAWFLRDYSGSIILLMVVALYWKREKLGQSAVRWVEAALAAAIFSSLFWAAWDASISHIALVPEDELSAMETLLSWRDVINAENSLITLAMALFAYWIWQGEKRWAIGIFFILLVFVAYGETWDIRNARSRNYEASFGEATPFDKYIAKDATVYWLDGFQFTWFLLGRSSYFSRDQTAGLVFSRPLAIESYRRYLQIKPLGGAGARTRLEPPQDNGLPGSVESTEITPATFSAMRKACGDPRLDYVILNKRYPHWAIASWYAPYFPGGVHLYTCENLRKID